MRGLVVMDNSIVGIRLRLLLLLNIVRFVHHCVLLLLLLLMLHRIWNRLLRVMRVMGMIWVVVMVELLTTTIGGVAAGVAARGVLFARGVGIIVVHYYLLTRIRCVVLQGCVSSRA